ncbi:hypothetical protein [Halanaerobium kushneri]|jgi:hypothetical protein|uniref:Uncharacterized protein n=1 Tax=Halanaerobium kushneri TaxID=56779 RepID=A0A1N6YWW9_9FIRM|nr:hypothetical protein [Halanaerobium kushneri]SIR19113.1 hypothetical protein SAMN05421834_11583 [Halanaerobium kushneri]
MGNIKYSIASTVDEFENLKKLVDDVFDGEVKELADDLFYKSSNRNKNIYFYAYDETNNKYVGILSLIDVALKLFLGEKTMNEINSFLPDCQVIQEYKDLINIIFPEMSSHFYMNY